MSATRRASDSRELSVRAATAEEWDLAWQRSPSATFFESRRWAELWSSYTAGECQPEPKLVSFDDGATVVVPLTRQRAARGLGSVCTMRRVTP